MQTQTAIGIGRGGERGVALIMTMLVMMLMSALLIGFTAAVTSDQRYRSIDRDRSRAFYGALSGLEKLNADLANLFFVNVAPTAQQIADLGETIDQPSIPNVTFTTSGVVDAYGITIVPAAAGSPTYTTITTGPYAGLYALKTTYDLDSSVRTTDGGEAHLTRRVETVAIPVFQFGMFSEVDLSFHAGANFNFGGRIHSNANLFLAQGGGSTLTLPDRVTAVQEVIRRTLVNGVSIVDSPHNDTVRIATAPGATRALAASEGSLTGGAGSAVNTSWPTISLSTYNGYVRDGTTGAKPLNLPLITSGGANTDLVRRPAANENNTNATLFGERYFTKTSLRILLSDLANDITSLPNVSAGAPVALDGNWITAPPAGYGPVTSARPPIARAEGLVTANVTDDVVAGNGQNIEVAAIPAYFKAPVQLTIRSGGVDYTLDCFEKDETQFDDCDSATTPAAALLAAGSTVSAVVATADGNVTVTTTLVGGHAPALDDDLDVVTTLPFAPSTFWVQGTNNLVTCKGYDADELTDCNFEQNIADNAVLTTASRSTVGTGTIGGFIKIEYQNALGVWTDVTLEILNWGIGGPNLNSATAGTGKACGDPTANAIIRLQRLRDNNEDGGGVCSYAGSTRSTDYWPNVLFDPREALRRDTDPGGTNVLLGGVMHYVSLDAANLLRWFLASGVYAGSSGPLARTDNGWSVYFSDRRNNRTAASLETGEYGYEDIINPASATGAPDGALQTGEDVNANNLVETYGQLPSYNGVSGAAPPGASGLLDGTARPATAVSPGEARVNRSLLFRRALKLTNGATLGAITTLGLTIAAENPVYVQGDWNNGGGAFSDPHIATAILADALTVLSNNWNDVNSFNAPYSLANRVRPAQSYYRFAVIAGKNAPFPRPTAGNPPQDFGTDGGAHNFLRMLESGGTVNYRGSIATFYYSRQANGVYKCCNTVYGAPTRVFNFDTDFLNAAKLPPLTPVFRDLNSLGFRQEVRPGK